MPTPSLLPRARARPRGRRRERNDVMHIKSKDFRVGEGTKVDLSRWPTAVDSIYRTTEHYQDLLSEHVKALSAQQELLYASDRFSVLLIFQAMDAAGKDGA